MAGQDDAKSKTTPQKTPAATSKPKPTAKPLVSKVAAKSAAAKPAAPKATAPKLPAPKPVAAKPTAIAKPEATPASAPVAKAPEPAPAPEPVKAAPVAAAVEQAASPVKPASAPKPAPVAKPAKTELAVAKSPTAETASKTVTPPAAFAGLFTNFILEDSTMDMNANIKDAMSDAQTKAKAAFEKGTEVLGEVSDFTKGNVEAVIESGKILAEGVQGMGSSLVSESRASFEAMTGDIKELAAAKSPTDFFKLQGDMMRKNFDSAVATGSKNSEAMLKLMSDVMAPISGRLSLAMEKVRTAA